MKAMSLSTKLFFVSGLILVILFLASFWTLYRAQTQLVVREMDMLLGSETLALSALVDAKPSGRFDFEMSPFFFTQYKQFKPFRFFRFIDPRSGRVLRESPDAPAIGCGAGRENLSDAALSDHRSFRVKTTLFRPEVDPDSSSRKSFEPQFICLIVGVDEAPYYALVFGTLLSTIPVLVLLVIILTGILLFFVKRLTGDLSRLTAALETADFGATHEFPTLPEVHTVEVKAVADKLAALHRQAAAAYRETWLFLGRAAHQLKTPVAGMQATLEVLLRKERSKEELLTGLADVEAATLQLAGLTQKLISSSRASYQEAPRKNAVDLHPFFLDQIKAFSAQAGQLGVSIQLNSPGSTIISANDVLLSEVFGNLIENAILYSPRGADAVVSISWTIENHKAVVLITDQGKGFPAQVKASLFEPFVRGDERQAAGSGLGLSIAKKSAQLMGGDITLRKSDPTGTMIAVMLPTN